MQFYGLFCLFGVGIVGVTAPISRFCYSCTNQHNPDLCTLSKKCHGDQLCGTEVSNVNGVRSYHMDCFDHHQCDHQVPQIVGKRDQQDNVVECSGCCGTNYCNKQLCNGGNGTVQQGTHPPVLPGPDPGHQSCYICNDVRDPHTCQTVATCHPGEKCGLHIKYEHSQLIFNFNCFDHHGCEHQTASIADFDGPHDHHTKCTQCCDQDKCNKNLCGLRPPSTPAAHTTVAVGLHTEVQVDTSTAFVPTTTTHPQTKSTSEGTTSTKGSTTTTTATTTVVTLPTTGERATANTTQTSETGCVDVEKSGFTCASLDLFNFCTDTTSFAHKLALTNCRAHCGLCDSSAALKNADGN